MMETPQGWTTRVADFLKAVAAFVILDVLLTFIWFGLNIDDRGNLYLDQATAGIVFMNDFNPGRTGLGLETRRRVNHAAFLFKRGQIQHILCVGGFRRNKNLYGAEIMKEMLVEQGIPGVAIMADRESYDSQTNWEVARDTIKSNQWRSIVIISSPLHVYRLKKFIRQKPLKYVQVYYSPYFYKYCYPRITPIDIWGQIHYEWLAFMAKNFIPESMYQEFIQRMRH